MVTRAGGGSVLASRGGSILASAEDQPAGYGCDQRRQKRRNGKTLEFSLFAAVGPFRSPIRGLAIVTDKDITIDIDLPKLLTAVLPERALEASVRGLLDS